MSAPIIKTLPAMAASVAVALSIVACQQGTLTSSVKRDGSLEFVATGQVTQPNVTGGISVGSYQGLAIDPTGIKEGSMHIRVVDMDGAGASSTGGDTDATDGSAKDGTKAEDATGDASQSESDGTGKEDDAKGTDDATESDGSQGKRGFSGETISGEAISGAIATSGDAEDADDDAITPQDGTTVFSRTFSAMDAMGDGEDGIVTATDVPEGYYVVFVSADHATGTLKVRPYDLSDEELADRETKVAMDTVKDWFKDLGLLGDEASEGAGK